MSEIILIITPVIILTLVVRFIIRLVKSDNIKDIIMKATLNILALISIILFLYTILCGTNYYRYTFASFSGLELSMSSVDELYELCQKLAQDANFYRELTLEDDEGVFKLSNNMYKTAKSASSSYVLVSKDYPILKGLYPSPKPVAMSKLMSKAEITGIFIPFTMEANVNVHIPDYSIPATMNHELAHLRGFMREDEANFIAYITCMASDNIDLQYSGTMLALIIANNALYNQNPELYYNVREDLSDGVIRDLMFNNKYWLQFEDTTISVISNKVNDTYLKANNQSDGVNSYGRMLDLLLAYYRK